MATERRKMYKYIDRNTQLRISLKSNSKLEYNFEHECLSRISPAYHSRSTYAETEKTHSSL